MERVYPFVLAGGKGTRLFPLTRERAKPVLPFAAALRLIDFTLSNCQHSGIGSVDLLVQHQAASIAVHASRAWRGGDGRLCAPVRGPRTFLPYRGTADAVYQNLDLVQASGARDVLVLSGDHVYAMDYRPFAALHRAKRADLTIASTPVPLADAPRFGIIDADRAGRVRGFWEKPRDLSILPPAPGGWVHASMGIYVFRTAVLKRVLEEGPGAEEGFDFGGDIIPAMLGRFRIYVYPFARGAGGRSAYWRDVGTLDAYYTSQLELLREDPGFLLEDRTWPFLSGGTGRAAAPGRPRLARGCLLAGRSRIEGEVVRSIVAEGVVVERGARVEESVLLRGAHIQAGATVRRAIVDEGARVAPGVGIGIGAPRRWVEGAGRVCYTPTGVAVAFAGEEIRPVSADLRRLPGSVGRVAGELLRGEAVFTDAREPRSEAGGRSRASGTFSP